MSKRQFLYKFTGTIYNCVAFLESSCDWGKLYGIPRSFESGQLFCMICVHHRKLALNH